MARPETPTLHYKGSPIRPTGLFRIEALRDRSPPRQTMHRDSRGSVLPRVDHGCLHARKAQQDKVDCRQSNGSAVKRSLEPVQHLALRFRRIGPVVQTFLLLHESHVGDSGYNGDAHDGGVEKNMASGMNASSAGFVLVAEQDEELEKDPDDRKDGLGLDIVSRWDQDS